MEEKSKEKDECDAVDRSKFVIYERTADWHLTYLGLAG
jgi:hypothetical protein